MGAFAAYPAPEQHNSFRLCTIRQPMAWGDCEVQ